MNGRATLERIRPDVHRRFQGVVARAIERADRERAEELARVTPYRRRSWADVRNVGAAELAKRAATRRARAAELEASR